MSLHSQVVKPQVLKRQPASDEPRIVPDLRRYRRVPLSLPGRFMRESREEFSCQLQDISVGGAGIASAIPVQINERIVAYFDVLGGLEGSVTRNYSDGFAIQFKVSAHKREKLVAQIMWLFNRGDYPEEAGRQHERVGAAGQRARLKLDEKIIIDVDVIDISVSGASLATTARPPLGTLVMLGTIKALVKRHHETGIALQFFETQDLSQLRQQLM